jgi:hypothetical protein
VGGRGPAEEAKGNAQPMTAGALSNQKAEEAGRREYKMMAALHLPFGARWGKVYIKHFM